MAIWEVAPVPGPFLDTNGFCQIDLSLFFIAIVMSYDTTLQQ